MRRKTLLLLLVLWLLFLEGGATHPEKILLRSPNPATRMKRDAEKSESELVESIEQQLSKLEGDHRMYWGKGVEGKQLCSIAKFWLQGGFKKCANKGQS